MKRVSTVCRYLLGLLFAVMGANGFLHFMQPPPPSSTSGMQFMTAVSVSHFMLLIFLLQLIAGVLLLANRYVPLALLVLAAILTNILNYHLTMDPAGIAMALFATVLWIGTALNYRNNFREMLASLAAPARI